MVKKVGGVWYAAAVHESWGAIVFDGRDGNARRSKTAAFFCEDRMRVRLERRKTEIIAGLETDGGSGTAERARRALESFAQAEGESVHHAEKHRRLRTLKECRNCGQRLKKSRDPECLKCNGAVCRKCGACGCSYGETRTGIV